MAQSKESQIKRFTSTAQTFKNKGDREWAYAKNGYGDEHYAKARDAYDRAQRNLDKANILREKNN